MNFGESEVDEPGRISWRQDNFLPKQDSVLENRPVSWQMPSLPPRNFDQNQNNANEES